MTDWTEFGLRKRTPKSARHRVEMSNASPFLKLDARQQMLAEPLEGLRSGEVIRHGLYGLQATGISTRPIVDAALAFLDALDVDQRKRVRFPIDATEWRSWFNVHINYFRHGVMLEELQPAVRDLGLGLLRATLSARGFQQARDIMRINGFLIEVTNSPDEYGEWPYFVSIFGMPSEDAPWGWQIDGHHLNLNCMIIGDQMVMTPTLMGSEPCAIANGPLAGTQVFGEEERAGLDMVRSLESAQAEKAILWHSLHPDELPEHMKHPYDGHIRAGAFLDNARIDYEGVNGVDLTDAQRRLLVSLIQIYVHWSRDGHAEVKMEEVQKHLDETWFSWLGATSDDGPFYYRVHSPVVLIEFDHQPGVVFDNRVPSHHHVHSIIRTPNGGDYGADLLRQHHERYDHSHGLHEARRA